MPEVTMQQWLHELVKRQLGYEKEWRERVAAAEAKDADEAALLEAAWAATKSQFVVADLETTGLKPESAELLELAALVVEPDGTVVSEFSALVRVPKLPKEIIELTKMGILSCTRSSMKLSCCKLFK